MVRPRAANWIEPMKIKLLVLIPMFMTAVTFSQTVFAKDAEAYGAAMIKARASLAAAADQVQLWTTSESLLNKAEAAAKEGFFEEAIEFADEARVHGELALATAIKEKQVWQNGVPKLKSKQ
jgi:hypothetical protein